MNDALPKGLPASKARKDTRTLFVYLKGSRPVLLERMHGRKGHYMKEDVRYLLDLLSSAIPYDISGAYSLPPYPSLPLPLPFDPHPYLPSLPFYRCLTLNSTPSKSLLLTAKKASSLSTSTPRRRRFSDVPSLVSRRSCRRSLTDRIGRCLGIWGYLDR
jgi:hypothetical protein